MSAQNTLTGNGCKHSAFGAVNPARRLIVNQSADLVYVVAPCKLNRFIAISLSLKLLYSPAFWLAILRKVIEGFPAIVRRPSVKSVVLFPCSLFGVDPLFQ